MQRIGDFATSAHVTVKALRHYAELGLLKPVWIDRFTRYRCYEPAQLERLNRILALQDLGFSLEQIAGLLNENVPVDTLCQMLAQKQSELEDHIASARRRLDLVASCLQQLKVSGSTNQTVELRIPVLRTAATVSYYATIKEQIVEYKIVTRPAFSVVGLCFQGKFQPNVIPEMLRR